MARDRKDRSANWIIDHFGGSMLRLAKISNFTSWRAVATVLTFPKQTPDGLLEVIFSDRTGPDLFLIEVESFPDKETLTQLRDDAIMVLLTRRVLPDVLLFVLAPKGTMSVSSEQTLQSAHGLTELGLKVQVVNLWTVPAEELLAANDVGLIPWVPLTQYAGPPEALLHQCVERIDRYAQPEEKATLLATTRVMAEMRYNNIDLLSIFGGQPMTMEKIINASPWIQRLRAEAARNASIEAARETVTDAILRRLSKRFGPVPEDVAAQLHGIADQPKLDALLDEAYECADLAKFRAALVE